MSIFCEVTKLLQTELDEADAVNVGKAALSEHYPFLQICIEGLNSDVDKGQVLESSAYSQEKDFEELMLRYPIPQSPVATEPQISMYLRLA
jgi:hypothetical protein